MIRYPSPSLAARNSPIITPTRQRPILTFILLMIAGMELGSTTFESVIAISILVAVALWFSSKLSEILDPYLVVLNSLPKSALAPLLIRSQSILNTWLEYIIRYPSPSLAARNSPIITPTRQRPMLTFILLIMAGTELGSPKLPVSLGIYGKCRNH